MSDADIGHRADLRVQLDAARSRELFGIGQTRRNAIGIQPNRRGCNRAGKRAAAYLVQANDPDGALGDCVGFKGEIGNGAWHDPTEPQRAARGKTKPAEKERTDTPAMVPALPLWPGGIQATARHCQVGSDQ